MVKAGIRREMSHWHDELPFARPGPHVEGRKSVREIDFFQVDFCPFRGPDAPLTQGQFTTGPGTGSAMNPAVRLRERSAWPSRGMTSQWVLPASFRRRSAQFENCQSGQTSG